MSEILVNTATQGAQRQPTVGRFAVGSSGLFFVVWTDAGTGDIKAQLLKTDGRRNGGEFVVNTATVPPSNTDRHSPAVAVTFSGPVVVWIEQAINPPGPRPHVKLQRFDRDGQKAGLEIQVSTNDVDPKHRPVIINMIDGGFLVLWVDARRDERIRAQRFNPEGTTTGGEFRVNTTPGFHEAPIAALLDGGNYVIAWTSDPALVGGGVVTFRMFDLEGNAVRAETTPRFSGFTGGKAITALDDGQFVIAHGRSQGMSDIGVQKSIVEAHVFEPGGESTISFFATSERAIFSSWPVLAPLQNGRFLLAWVQTSAETFSTSPAVKARVFSAADGAIGADIQVNDTSAGDRSQLGAATFMAVGEPEATFIVWVDTSGTLPDTSDSAVRGRALQVDASGRLT